MQWRGVNFDVVAHWVVALSTPDRKVVGSIPSRVKYLFSVSMSSLSAFWTLVLRAGSLNFQCQ